MAVNKEQFLKDIDMAFSISLDNISEELKNDPDVIVALIKKDQRLVNTFSDKLRNDIKLMDRVFNEVDSTLYHRLSPELKNDREFMLKLASVDPNAIYNLGTEIRNDEQFKMQCQKAYEINNEQNMQNKEKGDLNSIKENSSQTINKEKTVESLEDVLGKDKYKLASHYPDTLKSLENIKNTNKYPIFAACMKDLNNKNLELAEWTVGVNNLIKRFNGNEYQELLANINPGNIDIEQLNIILEQPNYFNIKNENDVKNYQTKKEQICDDIIFNNGNNISEFSEIVKMSEDDKIKFAVLQKHFGCDIEQAKKIGYKYYNIDELKSEGKKGIKSYMKSLQEVLKEKSTSILKKFYALEPSSEKTKNKLVLEKELKELYMQEYNKTLFDPKKANIIQNEKMQEFLPEGFNKDDFQFVDAGTEFNMIMTSVAPYFYNYPDNFARDWNRDITSTQGFSCSYIGNDMMGTTAIPHICYGFSEMSNDSMLLAGDANLGSATNNEELSFSENYVTYDTPQGLKDSTSEFNEMVFNRVQDGKRKQPDYLIVFKKGNEIDKSNMKKTLSAVQDFKKEGIDLPIVVIDVDKCIESEKNKIDLMINEAVSTNDKSKFEEIRQKIRNNSVANRLEFIECYKKSSQAEKQVEDFLVDNSNVDKNIGQEIYEESYQNTGVMERKDEVAKIVQLQREVVNEKDKSFNDTEGR